MPHRAFFAFLMPSLLAMVLFILPWGSSLALALSVVLAKNFIGLLFQSESGVRKTPPPATKIHR